MSPRFHVLPMTSAALIDSFGPEGASLVHADPPWSYRNSGARGVAANKYEQVTEDTVAHDLMEAHRIAKADSYLHLWCTFPKVWEFMEATVKMGFTGGLPWSWRYLTGGAWAKTNQFGVGFHWRGDSELQLLFGKGKPKPRNRSTSNLTMCKSPGHSIKPTEALTKLVLLTTDPGDLVVDLYAGESGSMGKVCKALGRRYVGAEIDPEKAEAANRAIEAHGEVLSERDS